MNKFASIFITLVLTDCNGESLTEPTNQKEEVPTTQNNNFTVTFPKEGSVYLEWNAR